MTTQTITDPLIEQYVAGVARRLPPGQREDVAAELRASILDSVEGRLDREPDGDRATVVREVLTELGDPALLARGYSTRPRQLIGPDVYDAWWCLLRALWLVAPPLIVVLSLVTGIWQDADPLPEIAVEAVLAGFGVAVQIFFWVTAVFWAAERFGSGFQPETDAWSVDQLPPLPRQRELGLGELVPGVVFHVAVLAWLPWQHFRSPMRDESGDRIPTLNPELWSSGWLWVFVALMVLSLATELVKYAVGSWTTAVTALVIAVDLATTGFVVALAATQQVVSTELLARASDPAAVDLAVGRIIVVSALVVGAMSVVEAVRGHRAHRARLSVG